jgi:hypothetical protein
MAERRLMPSTTTTLVRVESVETKAGVVWRFFDAHDTQYATFDRDIATETNSKLNQNILIDYREDHKGKFLNRYINRVLDTFPPTGTALPEAMGTSSAVQPSLPMPGLTNGPENASQSLPEPSTGLTVEEYQRERAIARAVALKAVVQLDQPMSSRELLDTANHFTAWLMGEES